MVLPVVSTPTFTTVVPSTGEQIEYRPFLVKEEKTLLIALEGKEPSDIARAVSNLLSDCILSNIDVSKLATFDMFFRIWLNQLILNTYSLYLGVRVLEK